MDTVYRDALLVEREANERRPPSEQRTARLAAIDAELARFEPAPVAELGDEPPADPTPDGSTQQAETAPADPDPPADPTTEADVPEDQDDAADPTPEPAPEPETAADTTPLETATTPKRGRKK